MAHKNILPVALTVAGSDSGGGAGIQADLRTFNSFGVFGTSAITAITIQNPLEVRDVEPVSPDIVSQQIRAVMDVLNVSAAKTGMLFSSEIIHAAKEAFSHYSFDLVVDPVMVSTSGARLLRPDAEKALKEEMIPICKWVTPNVPEAEIITGLKLDTLESRKDAAKKIYEKWGISVILKGGHVIDDAECASDIVCRKGRLYLLSAPRLNVQTHGAHGTGCTFSAALTACAARKMHWREALIKAKTFVTASLANVHSVGRLKRKIDAMYPPSELQSFLEKISLTEI